MTFEQSFASLSMVVQIDNKMWHIVKKVTLSIMSAFLKEVGVLIDLPPATCMATVRSDLGGATHSMVIFEDPMNIRAGVESRILGEFINGSARMIRTPAAGVAFDNTHVIYPDALR